MKTLKIIVVMCVLVVLNGCGPLCKAGAGPAEFNRDKYDCQMKTRSGSAEMMLVDAERMNDCMQYEKGWSRCK